MNYNSPALKKLVEQALKEDLGKRDITTELVIPEDKIAKAVILAKENCVICGLKVAELVFKTKDKKLRFKPLVKEGQPVKKGKILVRVQGRAPSILTAERVALNFLSLLSGIATKTGSYVNAARPYKIKIMDTRKTLPGLRELEKYAVRTGGGCNHRFRLDEMVLVKDNHIEAAKLENIIKRVRKKISRKIKIEVEVKNLREFREVLKLKPDIIMLDNMKLADIKKAVKIRRSGLHVKGRTLLEASGGVNLRNVRSVAATGVDMVSVGELTDSVKSVDISLELL